MLRTTSQEKHTLTHAQILCTQLQEGILDPQKTKALKS